MKLGILGDIHANLEAFRAVLGVLRAEKCLKILCTGDVVGYGPYPQVRKNPLCDGQPR
jgi:predicted phosphodiesterase